MYMVLSTAQMIRLQSKVCTLHTHVYMHSGSSNALKSAEACTQRQLAHALSMLCTMQHASRLR